MVPQPLRPAGGDSVPRIDLRIGPNVRDFVFQPPQISSSNPADVLENEFQDGPKPFFLMSAAAAKAPPSVKNFDRIKFAPFLLIVSGK